MKTIKLTFLFSFITIFAQSQEVFRLTNTPKGIFIEFGKAEFVGRDFELMRKTGDGSYKKIASLDAPNRENQLKRRMDDTQKIFIESARPSEKNIDETWQSFKDKKTNLYKIIAVIPQLEHLFGLAYLDDEVKPNERYTYQLVEKKNTLATSKPIIYTKYHHLPKLLMQNQTKQNGDIRFEFNYPAEMQVYSRFYTKRKQFSEPNSAYQNINLWATYSTKNRITTLNLTDTTLTNFSAYDYQIKVGDIFGNMDSTTHFFEGNNVPIEKVILPEKIKVVAQKEIRNLLITWSLTSNQTIQSLKLYRSRDFDKDYRVIANLSPTETSFEDKIEVANELYHYYFEVKDIFGNTNRTIKFKGLYDAQSIPKIPTNLEINASKNGAELKWQSADEITRGFYVFRRSGRTNDFIQISSLIPTQRGQAAFTDTTRLDFETTYYYSIKAESDTYDKSGFSETVTYKPAVSKNRNTLKPPFDLNITYRDDKLMLSWENLNATISQVLGYQVFRRNINEKDAKLLTDKPLSFRQNFYEDSTFISEGKYQFFVVSTDLQGNFSERSQPVNLDLTNRFVMTPENLGAEVLVNEIKLKWTGLDIDRIKNIKIYRAEEGANFLLISTLPKNKQDFNDSNVNKGKTYSYKVSSIDLNNKESDKSEPLMVSF
jgi:fibronectin type 3 domain-containing protein